jgi:soluble lytic murein transglycosylase-like protein
MLPNAIAIASENGSESQDFPVMRAAARLLLTQRSQLPALSQNEQLILEALPGGLPESHKTEIVSTIFYEAKRAGLNPLLVVAVMEVESDFQKYTISTASARGLMQIMPFWLDVIGTPDHTLFDTRTNIRFGCLILRHYLDMENGNLTQALARYNGSIGRPDYPNAVFAALGKWSNLVSIGR